MLENQDARLQSASATADGDTETITAAGTSGTGVSCSTGASTSTIATAAVPSISAAACATASPDSVDGTKQAPKLAQARSRWSRIAVESSGAGLSPRGVRGPGSSGPGSAFTATAFTSANAELPELNQAVDDLTRRRRALIQTGFDEEAAEVGKTLNRTLYLPLSPCSPPRKCTHARPETQ